MKTPVEWLFEQLWETPKDKFEWYHLREEALKMEKEQMEYLWYVAHQAGRFEGKGIAEENWLTFEQYHNETFKEDV